jgi:putative CRISPR-associated protein (TIGR02619 family)
MSISTYHSNVIVSSCGTSLLTNHAKKKGSPVSVDEIVKHSNMASLDQFETSLRNRMIAFIELVRTELMDSSLPDSQKMSAEINGLQSFYDDERKSRQSRSGSGAPDCHYLICSDTYLGEAAAEIVLEKVKTLGWGTAILQKIDDFRTDDLDAFRSGAGLLARWCVRTSENAHDSGQRVIFNLTGGFKALQGYMQSIGMITADEIVYIYEAGQLLRIPRLPFKFDDEPIQANFDLFRKMVIKNYIATLKEISGIQQSLFDIIGDEACLSVWGNGFFETVRQTKYSSELQPPLSDRVRYSEPFKKAFSDLPPDRKRIVNERLDDLCRYTDDPTKGSKLKRLDFKPIVGNGLSKRKPSTHECDAWADKDARRIFGHFDEKKVFIVDTLDKALH